MIPKADFKACALAEFDQMHSTWDKLGNNKSFWRTGNALDACVRFIVTAQKVWGANDPDVLKRRIQLQDMVRDGIGIFCKAYLSDRANGFEPGNWWDDYGWWGICALQLYENYDLIFEADDDADVPDDCYTSGKVNKSCCLQFAQDCWNVLQQYAWTDANSKPGPYKPPVTGGCWNNYYNGPRGGVQNSVTNECFLVRSLRLYLATQNDPQRKDAGSAYLQSACASYRWFGEWFMEGLWNIYGYLSPLPDSIYYWILERPTIADQPNNEYNKQGQPPFTQPATIRDFQKWSGDQGLFLRGVIGLLQVADVIGDNPDIIELNKEFKQNERLKEYDAISFAKALTNWIAAGMTLLFTNTPNPKVLHEAPLTTAFIEGYPTDYAMGKGVLLRYLSDARLSPIIGKQYDDYLTENAQAIRTHPPTKDNVYGLIWDDNTGQDITGMGTNEIEFLSYLKPDDGDQWNFSIRSSRLDALTAAISINNQQT